MQCQQHGQELNVKINNGLDMFAQWSCGQATFYQNDLATSTSPVGHYQVCILWVHAHGNYADMMFGHAIIRLLQQIRFQEHNRLMACLADQILANIIMYIYCKMS